MSILKKLGSLALCLSMLTFTGCNDEDVLLGVGLIAIGASRVKVGAKQKRRPYRRTVRKRRRRRPLPPIRGGSGRRYLHNMSFQADSLSAEAPAVDAQKLSATFNLDQEHAEMFVQAIEMTLDNDETGLQSLGFSAKDVVDMSKFKLPSRDSIQRIAAGLGQDPVDTKAMLQSLVNESRAQTRNVKSYLWESCMAEGRWKTPQNMYCTQTSWKGCSPKTGATSCVPSDLGDVAI